MILDECFATILECMNIISELATTYFDESAISEYHFNQFNRKECGISSRRAAPPGDKCIIVLH